MSAFGRAAGGASPLPRWNPDEAAPKLPVMKSGRPTNPPLGVTFNLHTCRSFPGARCFFFIFLTPPPPLPHCRYSLAHLFTFVSFFPRHATGGQALGVCMCVKGRGGWSWRKMGGRRGGGSQQTQRLNQNEYKFNHSCCVLQL